MNTTRMLVAVLALAGAGCVSRQSPHPDWPAATSLKGLSELDGVYRNDSDDHQTGKREESTRSLYDFLNGQLATTSKEGREVELRASPDGKELRVQLRGARGKVLASETLRADDGDSILARNSLAVKTPGNLGETGITNLGVFAGDASATVRRSKAGSLLGYQSETGVGLFGFMIPIAASSSERYHWPVIEK
jgi:hypothetical protein